MPGIYSIYIVSKSGGLIYNYDCEQNFVSSEVEKTFGFPLDIKLEYFNQRLTVNFGQRDGIRGMSGCGHSLINRLLTVGYALLAINGQPISGRKLGDKDVMDDILVNEDNYPINLKYVRPAMDLY